METTLVVPNYTLSGYGDRMIDLLCLTAYARVKHKKLYIRWEDYPGMPEYKDIPAWRFQDTKLDNFLKFFRLPDQVQVDYTIVQHPVHTFRGYLGGIKSPAVFYDEIVSKEHPISVDQWNAIIDQVKSELGFKVLQYKPKKPYAVVHVRRTDKLRGCDEGQMVPNELPFLNQETFSAIQTARDTGITDFYIATDDPSSRNEYVTMIESLGCQVIEPLNVHSLLPSYYDTWIMKSSSLIIASMRYSTFSLFPSLWWEIPLWTVLPDALHFKHRFELNAPVQYYKNVQLGK